MGIFDSGIWNTYQDVVGGIESDNRYDIYGGANDHYDGRYQLGRDAKIDAGRALGVDLLHTPEARSAFRSDPALQDRAFKAYTEGNHNTLSRLSSDYAAMSPEEQASVLAYAHNQGAGGALDWLRSGVAGKDAFGTSGQKYADAINARLGMNQNVGKPQGLGGLLTNLFSQTSSKPSASSSANANPLANIFSAKPNIGHTGQRANYGDGKTSSHPIGTGKGFGGYGHLSEQEDRSRNSGSSRQLRDHFDAIDRGREVARQRAAGKTGKIVTKDSSGRTWTTFNKGGMTPRNLFG